METRLDEVVDSDWRLFESVAGSRAYGTQTPQSDLDIRGVFVLPPVRFYGFAPPVQVNDATHDVTFYELGRFLDLLSKNNPNVLELLGSPDDCVRFQHPMFARLQPRTFLSKRCRDSFAGYAMGQIRKARGLNKKIVNPMPKERRSAMDFCHVLEMQGSAPLREWLAERGLCQDDCGLVSVPHMREVYGIYHDATGEMVYRGIFASEEATELRCSSVAKDAHPIGWMAFNRDGFKKYCREYQSYWEWVQQRNEDRYATNIEHGRNYDSKNMMHTFRLLDMAEEIAREGVLRVRRPNREELMRIREGAYDYETLVAEAEAKVVRIESLFEQSSLPEEPDREAIERLLVEMRMDWYSGR